MEPCNLPTHQGQTSSHTCSQKEGKGIRRWSGVIQDFVLLNDEIVKLVYVRKWQVEEKELRQFFSSRHISLGNENDLALVITDSHDSCIAVRHTLQGTRKSSVILVGCSTRRFKYEVWRFTEWLIRRAMFPLSVASITTSSLILKSCSTERKESMQHARKPNDQMYRIHPIKLQEKGIPCV